MAISAGKREQLSNLGAAGRNGVIAVRSAVLAARCETGRASEIVCQAPAATILLKSARVSTEGGQKFLPSAVWGNGERGLADNRLVVRGCDPSNSGTICESI